MHSLIFPINGPNNQVCRIIGLPASYCDLFLRIIPKSPILSPFFFFLFSSFLIRFQELLTNQPHNSLSSPNSCLYPQLAPPHSSILIPFIPTLTAFAEVQFLPPPPLRLLLPLPPSFQLYQSLSQKIISISSPPPISPSFIIQ
jgi:hypothetical protein